MEENKEMYIELIGNWNEKGVICISKDDPIYAIGKLLQYVGQMDSGDEIHIVCY